MKYYSRNNLFSEERIKFYAVQIILAIGFLHSKEIIYRDLKPENILLVEDGYIAISDFGISKILKGNEKTMSFCGTPGFLSPEIIRGIPYNKTADWWSLGALLFEFGYGGIPFEESTESISTVEEFKIKFLEIIKNPKLIFQEEIQRTDLFKDILIKVEFKSF